MLRLIRNLLKGRRAESTNTSADPGSRTTSIHIHEDDLGMRNLHPVEALPQAVSDVAKAAEAGERNQAPDGMGWTDVHVISPPSFDYLAVDLRLTDVSAALEAIMPRVRKFTATATAGFDPKVHDPFGAYEEDAHCYGFDASCFMKLEPVGDRIKNIWFECRTTKPENRAALRRALLAIDARVPSALTDYWLNVAGAVRDPAFLERYLKALAGEQP